MNLSPLFWTLGLIAVSIIVLLTLGFFAKARLRKRYPPSGEMVDVGGYRLHMHVEGEGSPVVVLEAGAGGIGLTWELVRPAVAKRTRVVVYDRAGLGWSDPSPRPRRADVMAEELHALLQAANLPGPYILAGHSLGGPVARQFAASYPAEVAGLVMVDSAHEQQIRHFPEALVKMTGSMKSMLGVMKLMSRLGVFALKPSLIQIGDSGRLPGSLAAQMRGVMASSKSHTDAFIAETECAFSAQTQPVATLGDIPLTVISHGQLDAGAVPPSLGESVREEYEQAWQKLQAEIASLSTRGRQLVAERSGHNIIYDQPELIVDSILEMVSASQAVQANVLQIQTEH